MTLEEVRSSAPYVFDFGVPAAATAGDTLVLDVRALDLAGNVAHVTKVLRRGSRSAERR